MMTQSCMAVCRFSLLFIFSFSARHAAATRVGDRHHGNTEGGVFYAFGEEINIIDPVTGDILNSLEGVSSWGDTVYMRDLAEVHHYVFANDRQDQNLWVIDTDTQEVLSVVETGDSPVHLYAIPSREEIWTHPDTNGTFDILHLGDLDYLAHSNLKVHDEMPGHGKLLWDPNLQDQAFATNTQEPQIYEIDLEEREMASIINMTLEDAPYQCSGTHGIGYSYVNQHLYVECSHPDGCEEGNYTDGTVCSGSTWEVDVATLMPVARLVSPTLNEEYGDSFGTQGQIYVTPDERYAVVANKYQNYVHVLKPVSGGDTLIIDIPVAHTPGKVEFWPKDNRDVWGPDSVVSNYWAVIAQEEQVDEAGIALIDLELAKNALENGESGNDIEYVQIIIGTGNKYRPLARGSNYAITPTSVNSTSGDYTKLAIVDLETQELLHTLDIGGIGRVQWVPDHDDEQLAEHEIRITALEEQVTSGSLSDGGHNSVETMAEAALALACVGFIGAMMAMFISIRNAKHAKAVSNGDFAPPLPCL